MSQVKIIVEGTNLSGKSSVIAELERRFPESVAVTTHGYYHKLFAEVFPDGANAAAYHRERTAAFLKILEATTTEEVIFNRLHITAAVYLELFYGFEEHFMELEQRLNELNVWLVLLDFNDAALKTRAEARIASGKPMPPGDDAFHNTKKKRDLYRKYFADSKMARTLLVDNSMLTAIESVNKIVDCVHTS